MTTSGHGEDLAFIYIVLWNVDQVLVLKGLK